MSPQHKFQQLLRDLFQFESADLDFGIYRILNHKRTLLQRWIEADLPKAINEEFNEGTLAKQAEAQQALEEARQKVLETLGKDVIEKRGRVGEL